MGGSSSSNKSMASFSGLLASSVELGHIFVISGKTTRTARRVDINLSADKTDRDIPLHISCRFPENEIVRNSKAMSNYGAEEKTPGFSNIRNPFRAGEEFLIYILVGHDRFHISLNNNAYCDFFFRMPLQRITVLKVLQDVEYIRQVDHRRAYPLPYPAVHVTKSWFSFSNDIPITYQAGHVIVLRAIALGNAQGHFTVRFLVGATEKQALHFNVRFPPHGYVVRNNTFNDRMEFVPREEERSGGFPFVFNQTFKIAFGFGETGFRIAVNGHFFCEYKYRGQMNIYSGIKCSEHDGLVLNVSEVDHIKHDRSLRNFEQLSRL